MFQHSTKVQEPLTSSSKALHSLSVLDGRYCNTTRQLAEYFSEEALIKQRIQVEVSYLFDLILNLKLPVNQTDLSEFLNHIGLVLNSNQTSIKVKEIETELRHDVKAVEVFVADLAEEFLGPDIRNFVHFGLTSEDINSVSYTSLLKGAVVDVLQPTLDQLQTQLYHLGVTHKDQICLAKTHGQPATPISFGGQYLVFHSRIQRQLKLLQGVKYTCKFGGATGGLNAHYLSYPQIDWNDRLSDWIEETFELKRSTFTTQVDHNDHFAEVLDLFKRISVILLDFCVDQWLYISMNYLTQKVVATEVGSSAMPHKVNPIDFENAEGNLKVAIGLLETLSRELPRSRLQRDLSNSTVTRNIGSALGYFHIALQSILKGLSKIQVNSDQMQKDLSETPLIIAEAIQTLLRKWGIKDPYNRVKEFTRNTQKVNSEQSSESSIEIITDWIDTQSDLSTEQKEQLKTLRPNKYVPVLVNLI